MWSDNGGDLTATPGLTAKTTDGDIINISHHKSCDVQHGSFQMGGNKRTIELGGSVHSITIIPHDTVGGKNPAPVERWFIP